MKKELKNQLTTAILSCPIVYIPHFHYHFIDEALRDVLCPQQGSGLIDGVSSLKENVIEFDCGRNCVMDFESKDLSDNYPHYKNVVTLLQDLLINIRLPQPAVLLFKNFTSQLKDAQIQSLLATFAYQYERGDFDPATTIIIASPQPVTALPRELEKYITVIDVKAPDQDEIMALLAQCPVSARYETEEEDLRMDLCRTLQGLQYYEVKQILKSALVRTGMKISRVTKRLALEEKKNIVRKSGIIEVVDANESFDQIGGLEILKEDLERKAIIYRNLSEAREYNVPMPKGVLIIGMPGCGKTMIAKSVANLFGVSLLRLDVNHLMGKYVGESETNLRLALATAEAAHPCVLWIDEIEKAFAGTSGQNSDMLVMRLMGHFLTWMQERTTPVFIVATANDVMRPEFMRKGRFDEVYYVNFPNKAERKEILLKTISLYKDDPSSIFDFSEIDSWIDDIVGNDVEFAKVNESKDPVKLTGMTGAYGGFSGAEIKSVVNMVIENKFLEYRKMKEQAQDNEQSSDSIKVKVTRKDFEEAIDVIKDSVMANQRSKKDPDTKLREKTNIERIMDMQDKYHFREATK